MQEDTRELPDYNVLSSTAIGAFSKIPSVKAVLLSDSNTVVTILSEPTRMDRCLIYDAEQAFAKAHPNIRFSFFSTESAAKYGDYHAIYQRPE